MKTGLNWIPLLPNSYDGSTNSSELFSTITLHRPRRKYSLSIVEKVCLQRRCIAMEVTRLFLCLFVAVGMCLPSPCLAMNVYSDLTIPVLGRHAIICAISEV
jgi:hypothetical protein